jgi:hypothetical protein
MMMHRRLLFVIGCCLALAWLAGPAGRLVVAQVLLLLGPGFLLDRALTAQTPLPPFVRPALWLGLSIGSVALCYQWATLVGLRLSAPLLHGGVLALALVLAVVLWKMAGAAPVPSAEPGVHWRQYGGWYALGGVLVLTLWTRFAQIDRIALPLWVDSVHHALLVRVAAESGQAPISLLPYLPVENLPYHWGYHVLTATLLQLSGLSLPNVMLWSGQILNALHGMTAAALTTLFWRRSLAGVVAALVVGLLSIMPAYYVSWGRYTQLTGLLMLPAVVAAWYIALQSGSRRWFVWVALLLAGLVLVHVRVLIFALCLMAMISLVWMARQPWSTLWQRARWAVLSAAAVVLLSLPWLWNVAVHVLLPAVAEPQTLVSSPGYNTINTGLLWTSGNRLLAAVALMVALWAVWRRRSAAAVLVGWVALLFGLANLWLASYVLPLVGGGLVVAAIMYRRWLVALVGIGLLLLNPWLVTFPALWLLNNETVIISLFLPMGVLIGGGVLLLWQRLSTLRLPRWRMVSQATVAAALCVLALWGTWNLREVVNSKTVLATRADLAAIEWARTHTPPDARFLINATGWLPVSDRGTDGGWWLLPLAGRWTSTPPVLYAYGAPDYVGQVQQQSRQVSGYQAGQEDQIAQLIEEAGITHIYLSHGSGPLTQELFDDSSSIETVYQENGITILAVNQQS